MSQPTIDQDIVVDALTKPNNYSTAFISDGNVKHIETHLSHIFKVGKIVLKLKRAVKFNFVDQSTVALRKAACQKELLLNKRNAPDLYICIAPIVVEDGKIYADLSDIDSKVGKDISAPPISDNLVVDWVVVMHRFDDNFQFSVMADQNLLTSPSIRKLTDLISGFHKASEETTESSGYSGFSEIIEMLCQNFSNSDGRILNRKSIGLWQSKIRPSLEQHRNLLECRRRNGYVRRCHGDLHLGNICLFHNTPTLFDCIEFSDDMSLIDVYYDLAFLVMDLLHRDYPSFANEVLSRYVEATNDYDGLPLLRFFVSIRAAIRAMVGALPHSSPDEQNQSQQYLDLANAMLLPPPAPLLIAIGGPSGTGKSTLARSICKLIGSGIDAVVIRSDGLRKRMAGVEPEMKLPFDHYTQDISRKVYEEMLKRAETTLKAGTSVIIDATFINPESRGQAENIALNRSIPFFGLWLTAHEALLASRIRSRHNDASDSDENIMRRQMKTLNSQEIGWHRVDASFDADTVLAHARRIIPV